MDEPRRGSTGRGSEVEWAEGLTTMTTTISNQRDQFQRHPLWTDRCAHEQCKHIAASHGPTETTNNVGKCRLPLCPCTHFRFPQAVAS